MTSSSFFSELKRRRVFRTAAVYAVVGWATVQVSDVMFPRLALPDWSVTLVVALVVLGFPIALALAWAFDVTPAGVVRTRGEDAGTDVAPPRRSTAPPPPVVSPVTNTAADRATSPEAAGAAGSATRPLGSEARATPSPDERRPVPAAGAASARDERPSVAVLPFANLSPDPENAYFADGLTEEVIADLSGVKRLRVISRTSVMQFREADRDLRSIARTLGVRYVLERSVRRAGEDLRVTAQLIEAETDSHLWAQKYTGTLEKAFAI